MGNSMRLVNNAVNSTFGNWLSGLKGRLFIRHADGAAILPKKAYAALGES